MGAVALAGLVLPVSITSALAPAAEAAERLRLDHGHVDAFNLVLDDAGQPRLGLKEDVTGSHVLHEAEDVELVVLEQARQEIASGSSWAPEELGGSEAYLLPLTQDPELLWPGWDSQGLAGAFDAVDIVIDEVDGPGDVHLWSQGVFGDLQSLLTGGGTQLPSTIHQDYLAHVHANWAFTEAGTYTLTAHAVATNTDTGATATTNTATYTFLVGDAALAPTVDRVAGVNRFDTAVQLSQRAYPDGAPVVYVASGTDFPDGLAAGPAAAHEGGPLLLTGRRVVPDVVLEEIERLGASRVVIAGGTASVPASAQAALEAVPGVEEVERIGGANRHEMSRLIATEAFEHASTAYVATGRAFPDVLAAGAAAGAVDAPVILVNGASTTAGDATVTALQDLGVETVVLAGGTSGVSAGIESSLTTAGFTVERRDGVNRYATAVALADGATSGTIYLASGVGFPDALAGSAVAAAEGAALLLATPSCLHRFTADSLEASAATSVVVLGGTEALGDGVSSLTRC